MNINNALLLILFIDLGAVIFLIRLYLKYREKPIKKTHYKDYPNRSSQVQFSLQSDYYKPTSQGVDSDYPDDTPAATHIFDVFQQNSLDDHLFGGGGAGDSYSPSDNDSGSSYDSGLSDSSSTDSYSDSSSSSWSD